MRNNVKLEFDAVPENESFARIVVSGFMAMVNPTLAELNEVKTAVSEAVTNAIIHGYAGMTSKNDKKIGMRLLFDGDEMSVVIRDYGIGILDIDEARTPLFTTKPDEERSGMGFTVMESFMDDVRVSSVEGMGTEVAMKKKLTLTQDEAYKISIETI